MSDCRAKGLLPGWAAPLLARRLQEALAPLDLHSLIEQIPTPPREWLTADPGTKSRRRRKAARNADVRRRGHCCGRCGATGPIQLHHVLPMYLSDQRGSWRDTERDTLDLCIPCHHLLETALTMVLPVTETCDRWAAARLKAHSEWLDLGERGVIESRVIRWALAHVGTDSRLSEAFRQASRLFLDLELPLSDRVVLRWQLRRRLGQCCQRCGTDWGLLYILSLPFSFVPEAIGLGFDPLDPSVGATLCHPCARSFVHVATRLGNPEKDLALAIEVRSAFLQNWIKGE